MEKQKRLTKDEKKLLAITGAVIAICVTVGAVLNIIGGGVADDQHPVLHALSLTAAQAGGIWIVSFFPLYPKEPRFPRRWRTAGITVAGFASLLLGYLLSFLLLNAHGTLIYVGPVIGSAPTILFRIIELRQTGREEEEQDSQ